MTGVQTCALPISDSVVERLASKYSEQFSLLIATSDYLEQETVMACGAECISAEGLRGLLETARTSDRRAR